VYLPLIRETEHFEGFEQVGEPFAAMIGVPVSGTYRTGKSGNMAGGCSLRKNDLATDGHGFTRIRKAALFYPWESVSIRGQNLFLPLGRS
jgi:hypothetical protein